MSQEVIVNYNDKPCYPIYICNGFEDFNKNLSNISEIKMSKVCIVTDSNVANIYLDEMLEFAKNSFKSVYSFIIPAGEPNKNLGEIQKLYEYLIINKFDRTDNLIALGGGVVGDMCGYAAATYLRGINFIQVPTTLLSQVDSSIGGKTGVDFNQYKNMVGAFHMPKMVYINTSTLNTLPEEQFRCGMAEIIKHALIRDSDYYNWLKVNSCAIKSLEEYYIVEMIYRSCIIKKSVVEEDPNEAGIRGHLNFGHTVGHAIEKLSDFKLFHGQCVAIGIIAAAYISMNKNYISMDEFKDIIQTLQQYGLPVKAENIAASDILEATKSDKKMIGNKIKFILLKKIGEACIDTDISDDELLGAIEIIL